MRLTRTQLAGDALCLAVFSFGGIALIYRALTTTDTGPIWGLVIGGLVILALAFVPGWHIWSVRAMPDPPTVKERGRQAAQAVAIGICLFVLVLGATLFSLAVSIVGVVSTGMEVLMAATAILSFGAIVVLVRMRQKIDAAMARL